MSIIVCAGARYQSWLLMECSRHTSTGDTNTLVEVWKGTVVDVVVVV